MRVINNRDIKGLITMSFTLEKWTNDDYLLLVEHLRELADAKYRDFHSSLVPDAPKDFILGVRMPILRALGREIAKGNGRSFLEISKTELYEERMLSAIVTGLIKTDSFEDFTGLCDGFIPQIVNWALCDCFCAGLKEAKKYRDELFEYIENYLLSGDDWKIRVAFVIMLDYYLEDRYIDEVLKRCDRIKSKSYYVYMAQAWLLATAYAKCPIQTKRYLLSNNLNDETFNKAIQKCIESRRIDDETKNYLKTLKRH